MSDQSKYGLFSDNEIEMILSKKSFDIKDETLADNKIAAAFAGPEALIPLAASPELVAAPGGQLAV